MSTSQEPLKRKITPRGCMNDIVQFLFVDRSYVATFTATKKIKQKIVVYREQFENDLETTRFLHNEDSISLYRNKGSSI